jgi:hypothetical protein
VQAIREDTMSSINGMEELVREDAEQLCAEIARYLAVVEAFRAEGCEPAYVDDEPLARVLDAMS